MKTTKAQFNRFCDRCEYWQDRLGLSCWDLLFVHENLDGGQTFAQVDCNLVPMRAVISFATVWPKGYECSPAAIDQTAFEEVAHILLWPITSPLTKSDEQTNADEHAVINRIWRLVQ
jgi:hypothetical protein